MKLFVDNRGIFSYVLLFSCLILKNYVDCSNIVDSENTSHTILTSETYNNFLKNNENVLVLYYASWCYWSKSILPEVIYSSNLLYHHEPKVSVGIINAPDNRAVEIREGIRAYPTLLLFIKGQKPYPISANTRNQIVNKVDKLLMREKLITTENHLKHLIQSDLRYPLVIGIYPESYSIDSFSEVAHRIEEDIIFGHIRNETLFNILENDYILPLYTIAKEKNPSIEPYQPPVRPYIVAFTSHHDLDGYHIYQGKTDNTKDIESFVKNFKFPAIVPFTNQVATQLFQDIRPLCVLIVPTQDIDLNQYIQEQNNQNNPINQNNLNNQAINNQDIYNQNTDQGNSANTHEIMLLKLLKSSDDPIYKDYLQLSKLHYGKVLFAISGNTEPQELRLLKLLGIDNSPLPTVRILFYPHGRSFDGLQKYRPKNIQNVSILTYDYMAQFINDFLMPALDPYYKSERRPTDNNDAPVKIIVGESFQEEVIQSKIDVFIEFYAPWCGHCRKFEPALKELAQRTEHFPKLMIAKMDATRNEIGVYFGGYPTIHFYPVGRKQNPHVYTGDRSVDDMAKWIQQRASSRMDLSNLPPIPPTSLFQEVQEVAGEL